MVAVRDTTDAYDDADDRAPSPPVPPPPMDAAASSSSSSDSESSYSASEAEEAPPAPPPPPVKVKPHSLALRPELDTIVFRLAVPLALGACVCAALRIPGAPWVFRAWAYFTVLLCMYAAAMVACSDELRALGAQLIHASDAITRAQAHSDAAAVYSAALFCVLFMASSAALVALMLAALSACVPPLIIGAVDVAEALLWLVELVHIRLPAALVQGVVGAFLEVMDAYWEAWEYLWAFGAWLTHTDRLQLAADIVHSAACKANLALPECQAAAKLLQRARLFELFH
jgi:hypothetical protein